MYILDENIPESQRLLLRSWRIHIGQIGQEIGWRGMKDEEIIPLLHKSHNTTFFTRDIGFYRSKCCHLGNVVLVTHTGLQVLQHHVAKEEKITWTTKLL